MVHWLFLEWLLPGRPIIPLIKNVFLAVMSPYIPIYSVIYSYIPVFPHKYQYLHIYKIGIESESYFIINVYHSSSNCHTLALAKFFLDAVCLPPILHIGSELVGPIEFAFRQGFLITRFHLVNNLDTKISIATAIWTTIMLS